MNNYRKIKKEETLKAQVFADFFGKTKFGYEPNIDNIDFVVTEANTQKNDLTEYHYLWAEAKKGDHDVFDMFTQLMLTCKKTYEKADYLAPSWLGVFDSEQITFVAFHDMLPIFNETDFNWNTTPSDHETSDFKKARDKIKKLIESKRILFNFKSDDKTLKEFIKTHFVKGSNDKVKKPITKDNFVQIFIKWVKEVEPAISISKEKWVDFRLKGILDCDFYRADIMSENGNTITEKLKIVLKNDNYKFQEKIQGLLFTADIEFTDKGVAYNQFWNKYKRPPEQEYQQYIIDRRDLLVPQNIREMKGSFFTPKIWADKSKKYITAVLGKNWQDEYYVWDCAAGTGNLLDGLTNEYNLWASDVDEGNVETIQSLADIDENLNLLHTHIFKFDFLNDSFDLLPDELKKIINDPEKRKKLIIYINPPYAEAGSQKMIMGTGMAKTGVAVNSKTADRYKLSIGAATNELSAQFMARIYYEIPACKLAIFSKLKFVCAENFIKFRKLFNANFKAGFAVHADTFDNVNGKFPIAFTIWDLNGERFPKFIELDIPEEGGKKKFWDDFNVSINHWIRCFNHAKKNIRGLLICETSDFQHIHQPYITSDITVRVSRQFVCTEDNLMQVCIYFAVRLCIEPTWLNDRDQFLYPNDHYKIDTEFQNDCLIFALFHGQNRISCKHGVNHWIPFSEKDVKSKEKFESNFMLDFLKNRTFSDSANNVLEVGKQLWIYYHSQTKTITTASVNASLYDIREFFQGRNDKGKMNNKSDNEKYNTLINDLRNKLKTLANKIQPKIYKYGFLKK
jgi:hypothetical protein